jgi:hypothetical protein
MRRQGCRASTGPPGGTLATPALFAIELTGTVEQIRIRPVWSGADVLDKGYTNLIALEVEKKSYLVGYRADRDNAEAFEIGPDASPFTKVPAGLSLGSGWDAISPFVLGNRPYLMCYRRQTGGFGFFELHDDFSVSKPYHWGHPRDPGLSVGFTTVKPIVCLGLVYFLGYNFDNGNVVLYSLSVTSTSAAINVPPLTAHHLWQRSWAQGWTRFAFFRLGGENFFLKTNTWRPNVNIDHIQDNPVDGTAEVATEMDLQDSQSLDICEAFTLGHGEPYFAAYKKSGETVLYQFHADCQGWTPVASGPTVENASHIVPIIFAGRTNLLFY